MKVLKILLTVGLFGVLGGLSSNAEAAGVCKVTGGSHFLSGLQGSVKNVLNNACQTLRSSYRITNGRRTMADVRRLQRRGYKPCPHRGCVHNRGIAADVGYSRVSMKGACQGLWGKSYGVRCYCGSNRHIHLDTTGVKKVMTGHCGVRSAVTRVAKAKEEVKKIRSGDYSKSLYDRYKTTKFHTVATHTSDAYFKWFGLDGGIERVPTSFTPTSIGRTYDRTVIDKKVIPRNMSTATQRQRRKSNNFARSYDRPNRFDSNYMPGNDQGR